MMNDSIEGDHDFEDRFDAILAALDEGGPDEFDMSHGDTVRVTTRIGGYEL